MTPNFVVVVSVLLPICCHIGSGMPYLYIFVGEVVMLLGAISEKMGVKTCLWSVLEHKQRPDKGCSKNKNAKFFACELWVKRVSTFGVVMYRNQ